MINEKEYLQGRNDARNGEFKTGMSDSYYTGYDVESARIHVKKGIIPPENATETYLRAYGGAV